MGRCAPSLAAHLPWRSLARSNLASVDRLPQTAPDCKLLDLADSVHHSSFCVQASFHVLVAACRRPVVGAARHAAALPPPCHMNPPGPIPSRLVFHINPPCSSRTKRIAGIKDLDIYALALYVDPAAARSVLQPKFKGASSDGLVRSQALYDGEPARGAAVEQWRAQGCTLAVEGGVPWRFSGALRAGCDSRVALQC